MSLYRRFDIYIFAIHKDYNRILQCTSLDRQSTSLDRCKAVSLRIILQDNFVSYSAALKMTALSRLQDPRQTRCLYFSVKCKKDKQNSKFFSTNPNLENVLETQGREQCKVNFCQTQQCHAILSQTAQQPLAPPGGQGGQGWIRAGSVRTRGEEVGRRGEKVGTRGQDGQTRKKTICLHKLVLSEQYFTQKVRKLQQK